MNIYLPDTLPKWEAFLFLLFPFLFEVSNFCHDKESISNMTFDTDICLLMIGFMKEVPFGFRISSLDQDTSKL